MNIVLGTAQFGLDYGVTNQSGKVSVEEMEQMLLLALDNGIEFLDTAPVYGNSEERIAELGFAKRFELITKIPSMKAVKNVPDYVESSLESSLKSLNISKFNTLMIHDENDFTESAFKKLEHLKKQGYFSRIGCSFYNEDKAIEVINEFDLEVIQIPGNLIDQRFKDCGVIDQAHGKGIEVHNRSLFLQGLLLADNQARPKQFKDSKPLVNIDNVIRRKNISRMDLVLSPAFDSRFGDKFVLGFTTKEEMSQVFSSKVKVLDESIDSFKTADIGLLDPRFWKQ